MRVVEFASDGALHISERPIPEPGPHEVVIKIAWAGVNRPDLLQRAGLYKAPPSASDILGLEASGEIIACGSEVESWQPGDVVTALLPGGGYAEYATVPAQHCLPVPAGLGLKEAASLPEVMFTVWSTAFRRGKLRSGERFLVHGGSSGIGTAAIQMAKAFGAEVYATAGSAEKCSVCETLGATQAIHYREEDFEVILQKIGGVDVILDMVGGSYLPRNIRILKQDGRLVQIAFLESPKVSFNFSQVMLKRLTLTGATLRPQTDAQKAEYAQELLQKIWPLIEQGKIKPVIDSEFSLEDVEAAHRRMESSSHIGKILLRVSE